jgi:hypothetical protein
MDHLIINKLVLVEEVFSNGKEWRAFDNDVPNWICQLSIVTKEISHFPSDPDNHAGLGKENTVFFPCWLSSQLKTRNFLLRELELALKLNWLTGWIEHLNQALIISNNN